MKKSVKALANTIVDTLNKNLIGIPFKTINLLDQDLPRT